jgi:hypothetical protein
MATPTIIIHSGTIRLETNFCSADHVSGIWSTSFTVHETEVLFYARVRHFLRCFYAQMYTNGQLLPALLLWGM